MSQSEAFRTCPYCAAQEVPKLVVYPRLVSGSSTTWKCRSCDRYWSDAQTVLLRASCPRTVVCDVLWVSTGLVTEGAVNARSSPE
jgi:transposase-like protein